MSIEPGYAQTSYIIGGLGPYAVPWPYAAGAVVVSVELESALVRIAPEAVSLSPAAATVSGDLYLSDAVAAEHAGRRLWIGRSTVIEQGWVGQYPREVGLEAQLDALTMAAQDQRTIAAGSIRVQGADLDPVLPLPGHVLIWDGANFVPGPTADDITGAQGAASAATAAAAVLQTMAYGEKHSYTVTVATDTIPLDFDPGAHLLDVNNGLPQRPGADLNAPDCDYIIVAMEASPSGVGIRFDEVQPVGTIITYSAVRPIPFDENNRADFDTQADFIAANLPEPVNTAIVEGRVVVADSAGPITADNGRTWRPASEFNAALFGFSVSATAAENAAAISAAIVAADGKPVVADCPTDFVCDLIDVAQQAVNLEFRGPGKLLRTNGAQVLRVVGEYADIADVTAIDLVTLTLSGENSPATRLSVASSSNYARGDFIRVVSDDLDPDARDGYTARRGETASVVHVATGYIYVAGQLEDHGYYTTNVRVARLVDHPCKVQMPKIVSGASSAQLIVAQSLLRPHISVEFENLNKIGLQANGCVEGVFSVVGETDLTADLGALTYVASDANGTRNKYPNLTGFGCRHVFTTALNSSDAGSTDIWRFGATRDAHIIDGIAVGCHNAPWDDHEGSRRTKFVRCLSRSMHQGTNAGKYAFQIRGTDTIIESPDADASHDALVTHTSNGRGVTTVLGGTSRCRPLRSGTDNAAKPPIIFDGHISRCEVDGNGAFGSRNGQVTIRGGRYEFFGTEDYVRFASVSLGAVIHLDGPEIVLLSAPSNSRFFSISDNGGLVRGRARMSIADASTVDALVVATGTPARVDMDITWTAGALPGLGSVLSGTYAQDMWSIADERATPRSVRCSVNRLMETRPTIYGAVGGTANALEITTTAAAAYTTPPTGLKLRFVATATNTGGTTLSLDGGPTKSCKTVTGATLPAGYIRTDCETEATFDGTNWILDRQMERGSNANGDWERYANGIQECRAIVSASVACSTAIHGGFRSGGQNWDYPVSFSETDVALTATIQSSTAFAAMANPSSGAQATWAAITVTTSGAATRTVNLTARGKWY